MNRYLSLLLLSACVAGCGGSADVAVECEDEPLEQLAGQFVSQPASRYRPYVWWHWMGSNFSKEGITKDLESMAESGIGGATIFNLSSAVQESHKPIGNNPWPEQTYRSEAYWEALRHAAAEAKRLGLKIGIQNTPGYSTTGGPWVTEERGMQTVVSTCLHVEGGRRVSVKLERPVPPIYEGWGSTRTPASFYKDIAVLAVPDEGTPGHEAVVDISRCMQGGDSLCWVAPRGGWTLVRLGYGPTMANPHPLPDELIGKTLEVDKLNREQAVFHWRNFLEPLKKHLGDYVGDSFDHVLIDSYEAGSQDWSRNFRTDFMRLKGYDPVPFLALLAAGRSGDGIETFMKDRDEVIARLFMNNSWRVAREMINRAGMKFYWEPYWGPFDTYEGVGVADIPMGEFWTGGDGAIADVIVQSAADHGKKIVGAEAFTGWPSNSRYTEDPAFLKPSADGSFASGVNLLFLHHWVHQPFDDRYQPGMGMGWWGTHFGRNQTWIKPAKAFFTYLSRCQMLLQQGEFVSTDRRILHRTAPEAEIYFVTNPADSCLNREFAFEAPCETEPELWDAYRGAIYRAGHWRSSGDSLHVQLSLRPHESVFVVLPQPGKSTYGKLEQPEVLAERRYPVDGPWQVTFRPKLLPEFVRTFDKLVDFSRCDEEALKYFSGTAVYEQTFEVAPCTAGENRRIVLDFGELYNLAELTVNGRSVGVLWYPPFRADVTPYVQEGKNTLSLAVTNTWANRLIGDEQYPADFEWGEDRGENGRAMKAFPEWFIRGEERPEKNRVGFQIWYYHRPDSPLQPAGLCGPVSVVEQRLR